MLKYENNQKKKEIEELCLSLIKEGHTQEEIVEICGYSDKCALLTVCRRNQIDFPKTNKQVTYEIRNNKIIEDRLNGLSMNQISKKYNLSFSLVSNICRQNGVGGKISTRKCENRTNQWDNPKNIKNRKNQVENIIKEKCPGFELVEYHIEPNDKSSADIKCLKCGHIENRSMSSIRHADIHKIKCDFCYKEKQNKKEEALKIEKEKRALQRQKEQEIRKVKKFLEHEAKRQRKICVCCGKKFTTYDKNKVCCSKECSIKIANNRKDKRFKGQHRDYGITAKALYEKENGVCWICGEQCDLNDYVVVKDKNGNDLIICGERYPSVDHINPAYKSGPDVWDNVRLAHRGCNSKRYWEEKKAED